MFNYMKDVAELLGIELNSPFKVVGAISNDQITSNYCRLTEWGIQYLDNDGCWKCGFASSLLEGLIIGTIAIDGIPRMPREGAYYYIPDISAESKYTRYVWHKNEVDMEHYHLGIVCASKEEAIALAKKMLAVVKEKK